MIEVKCPCGWRGDRRGLVPREVGEKKPKLTCPECGTRRARLARPWLESVATTSAKTAAHYGIPLHGVGEGAKGRNAVKSVDRDGRVHAFTDGSSSGTYAACLVWPGKKGRREEHARDPDPTPAANVPAEVMGVALALRHLPRGERVVVVSDFLGTALWLQGLWKLGCPYTTARLVLAAHLIETRGLEVSFVHHGGHQTDPSPFTRWNARADKLCSQRALRVTRCGCPEDHPARSVCSKTGEWVDATCLCGHEWVAHDYRSWACARCPCEKFREEAA